MNAFPDHIYISDLDGTLLQRDALLSGFARKSLKSLLDRGFPFTVATARSVTSTREILGDLPFKLPVICANGGAVYHYETVEPIHIEFLEPALLAEVFAEMEERQSTAFISAVIDGREKVFYDALPNKGMEWYHEDRVLAQDRRLTPIDSIQHCRQWSLTTITFMDQRYKIDALKKFFSKRFGHRLRLNFFENKYSPGWYWLSLHAPGSDKAKAIDRMLSETGLQHCRLTVFGDEWNDLPMFERADTAVAVGNALPSVKEAAHRIIGPHTEDAVIHYLLKEAGEIAER